MKPLNVKSRIGVAYANFFGVNAACRSASTEGGLRRHVRRARETGMVAIAVIEEDAWEEWGAYRTVVGDGVMPDGDGGMIEVKTPLEHREAQG